MPHFKGFAMMNLLLLFMYIQSLVELEFEILATTSYFEHTALLLIFLLPTKQLPASWNLVTLTTNH